MSSKRGKMMARQRPIAMPPSCSGSVRDYTSGGRQVKSLPGVVA
jgi:hypothetical protein